MSALLALGLLLAPASTSPEEVIVSSREARTCLVLEAERVVAGLAGGLLLTSAAAPQPVGGAPAPRLLTRLDGLPGTSVRALLADEDQRGFWAGTEGGLAHVRWQGASVLVDLVLPGPDVHSLAWHEGQLYAGTWGQGLLRLQADRRGFELAATAEEGAQRIAALASWRGQVWAAGPGGLFRLEAGRLVSVALGLAAPVIHALASEGERLWVGTLAGVLSLSADGSVAAALDADARGLWSNGAEVVVATLGAGLMGRSAGQPAFEPEAAPDVWLFGLHRRGPVTCVAGADGLAVERGGWQAVRWAGPPSSDISALARQDDRLLVGTFDRGLAVRVGTDWQDVPAAVIDERVNALAGEPGGALLWVATARGLFARRGTAAQRIGASEGLPAGDVHTVRVLPRAGIVAGTASGAAYVQGERAAPLEGAGGPGRRAVWALAEQADGTLWVGTSQGLFWRPLGGRWRHETLAGGRLTDDWVTALAVAGEQVYVGTYAHGVTRLRQRQGRLLEATALGGQHVNLGGLALSEDVLFAATMEGLLWRDLAGSAWTRVPQAAPGEDVTAVVAYGADVWVASRRGLARWRRAQLLAR